MKTVKWLISIGLMFTFFATLAKGFTIDGTAEAGYGSAISTQQLGTIGLDNDMGQVAQSDGSELDAAYGVVSNGVLYLVLGGNLDSGGSGNINSVPFDVMNIFFMTGPGGDHTLGTNYSTAADFGHINRMGGNNNTGDPGLTFDPGFAANYWIGVNIGTNSLMNANYEVICSNCPGAFLGRATPTSSALTGGTNPFGIQVALNNSNTNGVDGSVCPTNAVTGLPNSVGAATVRTGVELAIPLSAIGSPQTTVSICAFITDSPYDALYDQVLGPVVTNECLTLGERFLSPDGDSSGVNLGSFPGQHFFTLTVPPCNAIAANPASASFGFTGGTSNQAFTMTGACGWTAASGSSWITITSGASGSGSGSFTYSVATNTSVNPRTGSLLIVGTSVIVTQVVSITEDGETLPPLGSILIDGTVDTGYGCPVAVQQISNTFGKNISTNIMAAGGSELDAAYGLVLNNTLFLALAGNLQDNGNRLMIFFMTGPGGLNTLTNVNPTVDNVTLSVGGTNTTRSVLSWMGPTNNISPIGAGPGLTFDPGFAPNYFMDVNCSVTQVFFSYAQLWPGGTNASGIATNGYFLGQNNGTNGTLVGGTNPFLIQATINNSNTNGVDNGHASTGCYTNALGVAGGEITQALTVTTGIEMGIPLAALGNPTGTVAICAFIANQTGLQVSTGMLGPFGTNDPNFCLLGPGRTTNSWAPFLVLGNYPGQHYFYVGPELRVTSIAADTNKNVTISYLTEKNTNLTYQVQRTSAITNLTWTNIGGLTNGNGGIISLIDVSGATNKPSRFYRVRQSPACE